MYMSFDVPDELRYLETHEWVRVDDERATIGITDFAQDELGDVVFVELPDIEESLEQEEQFGIIESIKAVSDLYTPVAGTVTEVNEELLDAPELVNQDNYGAGWMIKLDVDGDPDVTNLLTAAEYRDQTA